MRKIPFAGIEHTSQRVRGLRCTSELPGRPAYVLVDYYYCFHLTSTSATTAVGLYIVHRNRKRFLLSQSTLREKFAEKKYQVFDIIGFLIVLVQVNLSSPVERV